MDVFLGLVGLGLMMFLVFGVEPTVEAYMSFKYKIAEANRDEAEANRDAKQHELDKARVINLDDRRHN